MRCSNCGTDNPASSRFCNQCGTPFASICHKCAAENASNAKFCSQCGESLQPLPRPGLEPVNGTKQSGVIRGHDAEAARVRTAADAPLDGERKTVTALFADIKGSTELMRELDPEEARAIIDPVLQLMMDAVHRYDGYVVQSAGDGIFALFGAPVAHEDHPQRAVHAAIAIQQQLHQQARQLATQKDHRLKPVPLEVRIGINTGEVVLRLVHTGGHTEYTPVGHAANLAARMQSAAPAGGIIISEDTRHLVEGYFELRELGPTEVKGVGELLNVYEVIGAGPLHGHFDLAVRRGLTKFVGREYELSQLKRALELARSGHGQIVAIVAEAGTGKSRLVYEFKGLVPNDWMLLEAYSVSHGKASAYQPVLDLIHGYFGIAGTDERLARCEKVQAKLAALDPGLSDTLPYLFALLGIQDTPDPIAQLDPQLKRRRMLDALKRIVLRESLKQPLVIIFEDLHWIDGETQALLDLVADALANTRILLLVNYRPEYRHEWGGKSYYTQLRLDPLGPESTEEVLGTLLGEAVELAPLKRLVAEKTSGNPFFIEEMVQALFDQGALVRNGAVKVARSFSQLRMPATVQGILASRIDRLPPEHKELIQILAVMGRESPLALIRQVATPPEGELEPMLAALQAGEFIYEAPAASGVEYTFKHALTQEVAYNSLLIERRKYVHERAGEALESLFGAQLDDHVSKLAHHYSHSDNVNKAVEYLERAGQQAIRRSALADAIISLNAAIELLQKLPDGPERSQRELLLQLAVGPPLCAVKGWGGPEALRAFTRAAELCERVGDAPELFPAMYGLWEVIWIQGKLRTGYTLAEQLLQRAERVQDPVLLLYAHRALGVTLLYMGELHLGKEHHEKAFSFYDPERHPPLSFRYGGINAGVLSLMFDAAILWHLGYPEQAHKKVNETLAFAQELSHPLSLAVAEHFVVIIHVLRREALAAQEAAESLLTLSAKYGFTFFLTLATFNRGWAMAKQGQNEEGIAQMLEGLATADGANRPWMLTLLAEVFMDAGRYDEGLNALAEALAAAHEQENRFGEPEIHRLKGELLLRQSRLSVAESEGCFQRAIEIARKQGAKSLELRATTGLARLFAKQGQRDQARTMLAEIYNWFTEGFDTADLKEAKSLLDELSA